MAKPDEPSLLAPSDGGEARPPVLLDPRLVEPDKYPLYGEIRSFEPDDVPLSRLLTSSGDVVLSRDIASGLDVSVDDEVVFNNSGTFVVKGIVSNEASGGVFAPHFNSDAPPMPWFAYLDLHDPKALEVFDLEEGDASFLFVKTQDDEEAEALAREIDVTAFIFSGGLVDKPAAGNVFVHLAGPAVELRYRAIQEISSMEGVSNLVEYHEFSRVRNVTEDGLRVGAWWAPQTLVARSVTPAETAVEMLMGVAWGRRTRRDRCW